MDVGNEHQPQGNVPDMPMCVGFKCVLVLFVSVQPIRITVKIRVSRNTGTLSAVLNFAVGQFSRCAYQLCVFSSAKWCEINMIQNDLLGGGFKCFSFSPRTLVK